MHPVLILFAPLLVAGCALQPTVAQNTPPPASPVTVAAVMPTKLVETRYDVRGYRESSNLSLRHEAHAVYRRTRVPVTASEELETVSRASYPPASVAPLPASEELNAELVTQKQITTDLRAMQTSMAETNQQMQAQYALLVRQSGEALKLRAQLETERNRIRTAPPAEVTPAAPPAAPSSRAEVKW